MENNFNKILENKMSKFAHLVYRASKNFPKEEIYGITSQLRRAALSVVLNYVEGYARSRTLVFINFLETSYGSLKESVYLLNFSQEEGYLDESSLKEALGLADEIGAMLWKTIKSLKNR